MGLIESGQLRRLFRGGGGVDESVQLVKEMHTLAQFHSGTIAETNILPKTLGHFQLFRGESDDSVYYSTGNINGSSKAFESGNLRPGIIAFNRGQTGQD